jgi:putative glutamine amidotransferase
MPDSTSPEPQPAAPPRIGIPYRQASEERGGNWEKIQPYVEAIAEAGGKPELVSLLLSAEHRERLAKELDGFLLPGSPADVDPALYNEDRGAETAAADPQREATDIALLEEAFRTGKPVLGICYGTQLLNVFRGGSLVQDIASELPSSLTHHWERERGVPEPHHPARLVPGSEVARLAEAAEAVVNSSHHQSIQKPGNGLRVTAVSPDGVVEAVERGNGGAGPWVVGVQWHPERETAEGKRGSVTGARLARGLFGRLVRAAREWRAAGETAGAIGSGGEARHDPVKRGAAVTTAETGKKDLEET